jgi:hypothetical protein
MQQQCQSDRVLVATRLLAVELCAYVAGVLVAYRPPCCRRCVWVDAAWFETVDCRFSTMKQHVSCLSYSGIAATYTCSLPWCIWQVLYTYTASPCASSVLILHLNSLVAILQHRCSCTSVHATCLGQSCIWCLLILSLQLMTASNPTSEVVTQYGQGLGNTALGCFLVS